MRFLFQNIEQFEKKGVSEGSRLHRQFAGFSERILERSLSMLPASGFVKVMAEVDGRGVTIYVVVIMVFALVLVAVMILVVAS